MLKSKLFAALGLAGALLLGAASDASAHEWGNGYGRWEQGEHGRWRRGDDGWRVREWRRHEWLRRHWGWGYRR